MTEVQKLTKKQKKVLEFRNKKKNDEDQPNSVKEVEQEEIPSTKKSKGKEKQKVEEELSKKDDEKLDKKKDTKKTESLSNKRKRKDAEEKDDSANVASKKKFDEEGNLIETEKQTKKEKTSSIEKEQSQKRYIVFVGNMSYKTTSEEITKHFSEHCDEKPNVRLLTTKGDPKKLSELSKSKQKSIAKGKSFDPSAPQSKGCAFVEFSKRESMQKALQFHHTKLHGRSINVELTAGGGGTGTERKEKIAKKNKDLEAERKKLHEKYVKDAKKKEGGEEKSTEQQQQPNKPQWGPNATGNSQSRPTTKIPRWAATGANAVRLHT